MVTRSKSQIAVAGRIEPGDRLIVDGQAKTVVRVKRAQGRKPVRGENLHLVTDDGHIVRANSLRGLRIEIRGRDVST